jgi:hypothetical protein
MYMKTRVVIQVERAHASQIRLATGSERPWRVDLSVRVVLFDREFAFFLEQIRKAHHDKRK